MSIKSLLSALHDLSLEEKLQAMQFLCEDVERALVNGSDLSSANIVLTKVHDSLRVSLRLYQQRSDEVKISEARLATGGHGLSLRELVKLPLTERHRLLSPFVAEMAEDFANDPELTEFAVLDGEDCQNQEK
ncbi:MULTISPECIES: hypothetical protein [Pseudanabaena]|uniref:hypothetical protein n=1 Tax=Pseudanabaena TaxID=1152 RepID=UPI00247AB82C|nr:MULTISPECIES: hypothetical protein [Pseudanabaena]MEA5486700.1 hypothetical protein [Pseudanabaena sp. CCNP1317]WGS73523.1 hypothetical protein OA858_05700 [Pseudanabaena galeata CCNP1313]